MPLAVSEQFLDTARGRVVALLRSRPRTVDEMATELQVTDNAVRAQLHVLSGEGLVQQAGVRRGAGAGKPARFYALTAEAERLLSNAIAPFLNALVTSLVERLPPDEVGRVLDDVGARLARQFPLPADGDPLTHVLEVVERLGAAATAEQHEDGLTISAAGCALAPVTAHHPQVCRAMRAFFSGIVGAPVTERCEHGERPKCRFVVQRIDG